MKQSGVGTIAAAIVSGLLTLGVLGSSVWADESMCRREVDELLDRMCGAFDNMDTKGAMAIPAPDADEAAAIAVPDATLRYADGTTMSIDEWRDMVKKNFMGTETMKSQYKILELEVEGPRAVVTYTRTHTFTLKKDAPLKYKSVSRWRTMLAKTPKGWRMKNYVQLSDETTVDGRPLAPGVSPPRW
jgi:hypothetical protein